MIIVVVVVVKIGAERPLSLDGFFIRPTGSILFCITTMLLVK